MQLLPLALVQISTNNSEKESKMSNYNIYVIRIAMDYDYCIDVIELKRRARSYKEAGARARQICNKILRRYDGEYVRVSILSIFEEG